MKKSEKKLIAILLAALMLLSCGLVSVSAAEADYELIYGIDGYLGSRIKCHVNGYKNSLGDEGVLDIPAEMNAGFKILLTRIADEAFAYFNPTDTNAAKYNKELKELIVADGVAEIGSYAFYNLANLEKVTIKGDVVLKDYAFANCANLKTVVFEGKNITVGASAFAGCPNLADIQFVADVELNTGVNAFNETAWFSQYPTDFIIAGTTLVAYVGNDSDVTIPLSIQKIGNGAFKGNATLKSITVTKNISSIGDEAFMNCSALTDVTYAEDAKFAYIGTDVFAGTPHFDNYEGDFFCIKDRLVKYLGNDTDVMIPNTVSEISSGAFEGCYTKSGNGSVSWQVSSIRIPVSVTSFADDCFTLYTSPSTYIPVLYVYTGTPGATLAAEKGYNHVVLGVPGDVDIDGNVSANDARNALRFSVGLADPSADEAYMADVDGDNAVTANDARTILRISAGLESVSLETLLTKPSTSTEILQYYTKVLDKAARLRAGYTKKMTGSYAGNNSNGCSLDLNTYSLYINPIMKEDPTVVNSSRAYESNTDAAVANLVSSSLICEDAVKSASCVLSNGKYYITINLNDEEAITDDTFVSDIYPVAGRSHFDSMLADKAWFKMSSNWFTYDLFYKNCTIKMTVDANTEQIESLDMNVTYYFDNIDGVINLLHVTNYGRTSGTGFASRNDTIAYSNFVY